MLPSLGSRVVRGAGAMLRHARTGGDRHRRPPLLPTATRSLSSSYQGFPNIDLWDEEAMRLVAARWGGAPPLNGWEWVAPPTVTSAYDIAAATHLASGGGGAGAVAAPPRPVIGMKIGASNEKTMALLGLDAPFWGRLYSASYGGADEPPGAPARFQVATPTDGRGAVSVECEWGLTLSRDLPPKPPGAPPYTEAEVADAIGSIHALVEVCGTRFAAADLAAMAPLGTSIISDHAGNATVVASRALSLPAAARAAAPSGAFLRGVEVSCEINGALVGRGDASVVLGVGPLASLAWLANTCGGGGGDGDDGGGGGVVRPGATEPLRAGMLVASGTMTGKVAVAAGDVCVARYGGGGAAEAPLAEVTIEFT